MTIFAHVKKLYSSWLLVCGFLFLCLFLFEKMEQKRSIEFSKLSACLSDLQVAKAKAIDQHKKLSLQINSESDPAWIELMLMKNLGLVPENYTKVYFQKID